MIKFIKNLFNKPGDESTSTVHNSNIQFVLKIDDKDIGNIIIATLEFRDDFWFFEYSEDFKTQSKYSKIVGFSNLDKVYKKEVLWPFFKIRIPGLKQPLVQKIIKDENLNLNDEASLLKRFGRLNISNPYVLEPC